MAKNKYAVMVYEQGQYKFVTKVQGSYAEWNDKEKVMLMAKSMTKDIAFGLCINGRLAMVVIIPSYIPSYIEDLTND